MSSDNESASQPQINTSGGSVVGGDVNTGGGDFVGRDKITITEEIAYTVHGLTNPYLGLRAFGYEDRAIYAGREQLARETVQRVTAPGAQQTRLFITGASGSGKSSFAQAALIPLLESHYTAYPKTVRHAIFRPSSQPLVMLADALQKLHPNLTPENLAANTPKDQINLLLIDQFEELFIQSDASQRAPFCDFLINLPSFAGCRTHIVITLRVDYLDELFAIQPLWAIAKEGVELRTMFAADLRNAIQKPLQVYHPQKRFAPELLDRLVQDAGADAALLPLLQVTLAELWKTGKLVLSNYHSLTDAIRQRAEMVYDFSDHASADPKTPRPAHDQQELMSILLDLINVSVDGTDHRDARQRRTRQELEQGSAYRSHLIEELVNARLLAAANETRNGEDVEVIDIIHESLIDNWDRLRKAIEEQRQQLQRRARFKLWLGEWLRNERQDGYLLLTDMQLAEARALVEGRDIEVQGAEAREFYQRSLDQREAERYKELQRIKELAEAQQRQAQTFRWAAVISTVLTILAVIAAGVAITQNRSASARNLALLAQNAMRDGNLHYATLLALEARRLDVNEGESILRQIPLTLPATKGKTLLGHTSTVNSVMWSPDGKQLTSASSDNTVRIWEAATGTLVKTLIGHTNAVRSVTWSPDGKQLASASADNTVRIWEVATGTLVKTFVGHTNAVNSVTWSPDGKQLASASSDNSVRIWEAATGTLVKTLVGHTNAVNSVRWSPDGKQLASASDGFSISSSASGGLSITSNENAVHIWEAATGTLVKTLVSQRRGVLDVTWSLDGKQIASASDDSTVHIWEAATGTLVKTLVGHANMVNSVTWSPDGKQLASASSDNSVRIWEAATGTLVKTLVGHTNEVTSVRWSPDGKQLASASVDDTVRIWKVAPDTFVKTLVGHTGEVNSMTWSPDGKQLASASADSTVRIWEATTGDLVQTLSGHTGEVTSATWKPDGKQLATVSGELLGTIAETDNTVRIWEVATGELVKTLEGRRRSVRSVAWSPDSGWLAAVSGEHNASVTDNAVRIWEVDTDELVQTLSGHTDEVTSATWSPNGKWLAVNSGERTASASDNTVRIWRIATGELVKTLEGQTRSGTSVAWSPDSRWLAVASADGMVRIWEEATTGELVQTFSGHTSSIWSVTWSPDGKQLATTSADSMVRIWEATTGELVQTLSGHTSSVWSVTWSPDGKELATSDYDNVRIWEATTGELVQILETLQGRKGLPHLVKSVTWSPDGRWLASALNDNTIMIWPEFFTRSPCYWTDGNLSVRQWLEIRGWTIYHRTCPEYPAPELPSIWTSLNGDKRMLLLSWQGVGLLGILPLGLILWAGYKSLRWLFRNCDVNHDLPQGRNDSSLLEVTRQRSVPT